MDDATRRRPLDGYRVLDLATMVAAPFCAGILGEFGADVVKIEMPGAGDPWRQFGTLTEAGYTLNWLNEARNKKSLVLDLRKPKGVEIAKRLAAKCDVVIENFRPGTLEKWGLGFEELKALKPDLILIRVSAYGQDGPNSALPGYARVAHGYAGLAYLTGQPDGPPVVPGSTSLADYITGTYAAIGALLALIARDRFGIGQSVDIGLYEGVLRMLDEAASVYAKTGVVRQRMGADTVNAVPHSHYETKDGRWIALACSSNKMFQRLTRVMNRPDLMAPDRFATVDQRVEHRDEVNGIVADWIRQHLLDDVLSLCREGDVPIGPINSIADVLADPHIRARGNFVEFDHAQAGKVVVPNVLPRLSETPGEIRTLGPALGEHSNSVLKEYLGLDDAEIEQLRIDEII
jgi:crotonobetainyl-CoA:carnitine CoA-transferase CaiB-like acyl-CoA transferase